MGTTVLTGRGLMRVTSIGQHTELGQIATSLKNEKQDEKPKRVSEPILNGLGLSLIAVISTASAIVALVVFGHYWQAHNEIAEARTFAFSIFAVNSMVYIFAYRSLRRSLLRGTSLAKNKPLVISVGGGLLLAVGAVLIAPIRDLLGIVPLHWYQWGVVFGGAVGLLGVVELAKFVFNRRGLRRPTMAQQT